MEKFKLILFALTPLIFVGAISSSIWYNLDSTKIKMISSNLKVIDGNIDHNQALDVAEYAQKENIDIPKILINFDTHSDIYVFDKMNFKDTDIYNWINEYVAMYPQADEIYWVMPIEEVLDPKMQKEFILGDTLNEDNSLYGNSKQTPDKVNPNVHKTPFIQYFKINIKNGWMEEVINPNEPLQPDFKMVKLITCTEETLPNFKNKKLFLSIDADYISNSGFDTTLGFTNNKNPKEIKKVISKLLSTLRKKNIRPEIISMSMSPDYVPKEDEYQLFSFIQKFIKHSGKSDTLKEYSRMLESEKVKEGQKKYSGF